MSEQLSQSVKDFVTAQSAEQLAALKDFICFAEAQQAKGMNNQHAQNNMRKKSKAGSRAKAKKPVAQPAGIILAAKRPLNSWMAYRAFYSPVFTSFQQKEISGFLTLMWRADPFHAKWALAAKAWSVIRDKVGKDAAPLDEFLQLVCPHIGRC